MRKVFIAVMISAVFAGCSQNNDNDPILPPTKATLVFPEANALCTPGVQCYQPMRAK
jgi:hypothetical protein